MIRLFRSIRQGLINEGKTSKYIKYAVGEVLLVMIGILLALQVNNWNEGRKQNQERLELIENLKVDFKANIELAERRIESTQIHLNNHLRFLRVASGEEAGVSVEELRKIHILGSPRFEPALSTYFTARSTGSIGLIADPEVNKHLVRYERMSKRWDNLRQIVDEETYGGAGGARKVAEMVGTENAIHGGRFLPKRFELSDEEYLEVISSKVFFAQSSSAYDLTRQMVNQIETMKEVSEDILAVLDAL
jgi:hypothetical protein